MKLFQSAVFSQETNKSTLYTIGIYLLGFLLKIFALFNDKIRKGVIGRQSTFSKLKAHIHKTDKTFWFHCASLGEYEQGLPVFEALKTDYPSYKIILSFFSPSGYEIRKNSKIADVVVYLPLDTKAHAKRFLDLAHPDLTVFVKYDVWPNILKELKARELSAILVSAQFRKSQPYFKFYGNSLRQALFAFDHIFVQDDVSKYLLEGINYHKITISGDTRYDRVFNQLHQNNQLDFIIEFKAESTCVVIGSSWPEDEAILLPYINTNASEDLKFIIAPHEMKSEHIKNLLSKLRVASLLFSEKEGKTIRDFSVLIVDTIGLLSKIYSSADIAYVGGAAGTTGLHNILEPAVFGVPIIIGKNYQKFPEAKAMIENAAVTSVKNATEFETVINTFVNSKTYLKQEGQKNSKFIKKNRGAVVQIMSFLRTYLQISS